MRSIENTNIGVTHSAASHKANFNRWQSLIISVDMRSWEFKSVNSDCDVTFCTCIHSCCVNILYMHTFLLQYLNILFHIYGWNVSTYTELWYVIALCTCIHAFMSHSVHVYMHSCRTLYMYTCMSQHLDILFMYIVMLQYLNSVHVYMWRVERMLCKYVMQAHEGKTFVWICVVTRRSARANSFCLKCRR